MIGQSVHSLPPSRLGVCIAAGGALLFTILALLYSAILLALLVVPCLVYCLTWPLSRNSIQVTFTQSGIRIHQPDQFIAYDEIQGLEANRPTNPYVAGRRAYAIRLLHVHGTVLFPARLNVPSDTIYSFLYHHLTSSSTLEVDPSLLDYLHAKIKRYGKDRVWAYRRRAFTGGGIRNTFLLRLGVVCLITGITWFATNLVLLGNRRGSEVSPGIMCSSIFLLPLGIGLLIGISATSRGWKTNYKIRRSSLIICPEGLALRQGELLGEMYWDEVRRIHLGKKKFTLFVSGAEIVLNDVYDRPLAVIGQLIQHYYQNEIPTSNTWRFDATLLHKTPEQQNLHRHGIQDRARDAD